MSGSVNRVIVVGNLGRAPEIKSFSNGGRVANLAVATSESWKDKTSGERKEKTEWHRVSVMDERLVELCEKYLHKGSKVYLEGQLETRKWKGSDGKDNYSTEIVLRPFRSSMQLLDPPSGDSVHARDEGRAPPRRDSPRGPPPTASRGRDDALDDDIPF